MFGVVKKLCRRVAKLDEDKIITKIFDDKDLQARIVNFNQMQMLAGKGADSNNLPRYDQDPYFKTPNAAKAYQAWKAHVSPNKEKDPAVMDFYIDGHFHKTLKVVSSQKAVTIKSDSEIAGDIQDKTNQEALGLNKESLARILPTVQEEIINEVKKAIYR